MQVLYASNDSSSGSSVDPITAALMAHGEGTLLQILFVYWYMLLLFLFGKKYNCACASLTVKRCFLTEYCLQAMVCANM